MDLSDNDELALLPSASDDDKEMVTHRGYADQDMTIKDVLEKEEETDKIDYSEEETDWVSIFQGHFVTQNPSQEENKTKDMDEESAAMGVFTVACHPENPMLFATGGADDRAFLVHLEPGLCSVLSEFSQFKDSVTEASWWRKPSMTDSSSSRGISFLALGSMDGTCLLVRVNSKSSQVESFFMIEGPTEAITCLMWHPRGGPDLLIGSADQTLWLWRIKEEKDFDSSPPECIHVMSLNAPPSKCCFTLDGKFIVTGGEDGMVTLWCPRDGKQLAKYPLQGGQSATPVTSLACHPTGQALIIGHEDGTIRCLKTGSSMTTMSLEQVHHDSIEHIAFYEDKMILMATASLDGKVMIWDAATLKPRLALDHNHHHHHHQVTTVEDEEFVANGVTCMEWLPRELKHGGHYLITCTLRGECWLWDARTGAVEHRWTVRQDESACTALSVSHVAKMFVVGFEDGLVAVYDYA